jgi:hypothetical protein
VDRCKPLLIGVPSGATEADVSSYFAEATCGAPAMVVLHAKELAAFVTFAEPASAAAALADLNGTLRPPGSSVPLTIVRLAVDGTCLHSSTSQLNLSRFCHKIQPKTPLIPPPDTPHPTPQQPLHAPPIPQKALKLS